MKKLYILLFTFQLLQVSIFAQDTFSIVAVDSLTGEVGSAGASCVDLIQFGINDASFIGQLLPGLGAINTQAYYLVGNQTNATEQLSQGLTPQETIDWLVENDVQNQAATRQYGIAGFVDGAPQTAAHTGSLNTTYANHIIGANYSIQGNILLGQSVLDDMEERFLNEPGDLACKLMAALQGANVVGADTRCANNGTSSLFAYVKVAQANDSFGNPSFNLGVITRDNDGIEPIDSLQTVFNAAHQCNHTSVVEIENFKNSFSISPNPSTDYINIQDENAGDFKFELFNASGEKALSKHINHQEKIDVSELAKGVYFIKIKKGKQNFVQKMMIR